MSNPSVVDCAAERFSSKIPLAVTASLNATNLVPVSQAPARTIPVHNGTVALCDEQDFAFLSQFKWRIDHGIPWALTKCGGQYLYMHQLVLLSETKRRVNHRDGNYFNNCRSNLRFATRSQFKASKPKRKMLGFSSLYKGVRLNRASNRWVAKIDFGLEQKQLGTFDTEEAAARAYDTAARETFGDFAYLNFPAVAESSHLVLTTPILDAAPVSAAASPSAPSAEAQSPQAQTIPVIAGPPALCDLEDFAFLSRFSWRTEKLAGLYCPATRIFGKTIFMQYLILNSTNQRRVAHLDGNAFNNCRANLYRVPGAKIYFGNLASLNLPSLKGTL